ncbi:hypothetical protein K458DRAFT_440797 [Lentithecium fluviatile CBS 122367]|uniref:Ubiquitin carboxyl-terminal hydrolase 14 n=1 Tax=Lentithecium fluviatile CBS 122367 TaxID=1168545 RepID=A0A6G1JBY3_9PLEO|nr:hypothetical protein K458DRAFT_440797 [Lentithecium fluviatile CBS 122367]
MSKKSKKRSRDESHDGAEQGAPAKRKRQVTDDKTQLYKLYEDLAAESDETRLKAAEQLILRFSPENNPASNDVQEVLNRLIRGLCTQRKAARLGFCVTLTELLRQLLGKQQTTVEGLDLDVESLLKRIEKQTKVESNASGMERRDHLIGKLFAYKAIMQSGILLDPEFLDGWNELLDRIYGMARDVPWLREECGLVLVEAVSSLGAESQLGPFAQALVQRLVSTNLANTPEGVAIWLALRANHDSALPAKVWHGNDPLAKRERARLAKILKEDFRTSSKDGKNDDIKSAAASHNPSFAWDLLISKVLEMDKAKGDRTDAEKSEFAQFWLDTVDAYLFGPTSSHERKSWGFKLFSRMVPQAEQVPDWALPALFSPNLMRTLLNQTKKDDRFLHAAALNAWKAIPLRAQASPKSALGLVIGLTSKNGSADFDSFTKSKTLEQVLLSADDQSLRKIVKHFHSLIIRPETTEQPVADHRRQTIADLLLNLVRNYKRYDDLLEESSEKDSWLRNTLEILVEQAYFAPSQSAKTRKIPLPLVSETSRKIFQERLSSCLTRLLNVESSSETSFGLAVVGIIRAKATSSKGLEPLLKADESVMETVEKAFQSLDVLVATDTKSQTSIAQGFALLYTFTLLQVYNGDTDAVMMLEDLQTSSKAMLETTKDSATPTQDGFVEILLSFLGNPRTLFHKTAVEAFTIFASALSLEGLRSLTDVLDTEESLEGQKRLFAQEDDEIPEDEDDEDDEDASDVEMIDANDSEESTSEDSSTDDESEDDEELVRFNNMLAMTLQTSKLSADSDASDDTSDESDMDDEQMMALDPHLSNIFKQRSQITGKKERENAKQNMVQFKSRVLNLLALFLDKQYSNALTLEALLSILRLTRATANKQLSDKSAKLLKSTFDSHTKHKTALPKPDDVDSVWEVLKGIHEEAKLGGGAIVHANACSTASLHLVRVLVGLDRENYKRVVDVYAESQNQWFSDKMSHVQPVLFTQFLNCHFPPAQQRSKIPSHTNSQRALANAIPTDEAPHSRQHPRRAPPSRPPRIHLPIEVTSETRDIATSNQSTLRRELRPPGPTQSVYREDCTQCFDSIDDPTGLDVCLFCFNGGCTSDRGHSALHASSTSHPLVLNIKRTRKKVKRDEPPQKVTKLAIAAETESDHYDTTTQVNCHACGINNVNKSSGKLPEVVDAVLKANTFAREQEVKAWEQELTACEHTLCLEQEAARQIESQSLGHCASCELKENLWLCLTCGNLGCGRSQFGGIGGNSHGVAHTKSSGHPVAVKLGSLTADGTADIYCYACDEERVDPELPNHLMHWGINIKDRIKTEKSLTEMQVEQNLLWEFSMTTEDGKELKPLFGPGFTGLKNLGNSCYLASTVQALFSMPEFAERYYLPDQTSPTTDRPAEDLETQLRKLADGLLSGRYSKPDSDVITSENTPENPHQKGLAPAMLKHLIGRGHPEFSTMRQQDAFELLLHLLKLMSRSQHVVPLQDPVNAFRFVMEQRLQCMSCKKVRYREDEQENISVPVPIRRIPKEDKMEVTDSEGKEKKKEEFEPVTLKECLDIFTADELVELTCGACGSKDGFLKKSLFKTFPSILAVNARRFEVVNWVPTKQDVPVIVGDEPFSFDEYKSRGLQYGEELLPEDADNGSTANKWVPNEGALSMLEAMGFPRVRCEKALHATGNADPEAASNWLFGHMEDPDIDDPVDFNASSGSGRAAASVIDPEKIESLGAMGFNAPQARQALKETGGDMERAVDWLFSHPDAACDFDEGGSSETQADAKEKALPGSDKLPARFQLQSIVCHKGSSIHAGHYVAFIRKQIPDEQSASWVLFNDEKVAKAGDVEEMKKFAYVYFFRRL